MSDVTRGVGRFDGLPPGQAKAILRTCLDVPRWVDELEVGRPYATWSALQDAATGAAATITDDELDAALARHPRIGERAGSDHDAEHSEREQSGVDPQDRDAAARLAAGNAAYERRFDRVFLIRASGRSAPEILSELDRRLASPAEEERAETVRQLGEIAVLRLESLL